MWRGGMECYTWLECNVPLSVFCVQICKSQNTCIGCYELNASNGLRPCYNHSLVCKRFDSQYCIHISLKYSMAVLNSQTAKVSISCPTLPFLFLKVIDFSMCMQALQTNPQNHLRLSYVTCMTFLMNTDWLGDLLGFYVKDVYMKMADDTKVMNCKQ